MNPLNQCLMISGHALLGSLFCLENETNTVKRREEEEYEVDTTVPLYSYTLLVSESDLVLWI